MQKFIQVSRYFVLLFLISLIFQNLAVFAFPFGDIKVNTLNQGNGHHARSTIALGSDGGFVVCWTDPGRYFNSEGWIQCQRFNSDGSKKASEIQVNSSPHQVDNPAVILDSDNNYIVCWNDGVLNAVRCRKVDVYDNFVGSEFQANTTGYLGSTNETVSMGISSNDNIIVCWERVPKKEGNNTSAVYCQNFNKQLEILGSEIRIDNGAYQFNLNPSVSRNSNGLFVVCWTIPYEVICQRLDENGNKQDDNFKINTLSDYQIDRVRIGLDNYLDLIACWEEYGNSGVSEKIICQRIDKDNQKIGTQFHPYTFQGTKFITHNLSVNINGESVICWQSQNQISQYFNVFCQQYNSDGSLHFAEYKAALSNYDSESGPSVALNTNGQMVTCWNVDYISGAPSDIYCNGRLWDNDPNPPPTPTITKTPTPTLTPSPTLTPTQVPTMTQAPTPTKRHSRSRIPPKPIPTRIPRKNSPKYEDVLQKLYERMCSLGLSAYCSNT